MHDGTPVTAKDVTWSFDRAVSVGSFATFRVEFLMGNQSWFHLQLDDRPLYKA